nr:MAG TPA: hypothetical protein [Caudoviricetes sp.]
MSFGNSISLKSSLNLFKARFHPLFLVVPAPVSLRATALHRCGILINFVLKIL